MNSQFRLENPQEKHSEVILVSSDVNKELIKNFAWRCFNASYGADLKDYLPQMLALIDNNQQISASAGYQSAAGSCLYLEQHLNSPIDYLIQKQLKLDTAPKRSQILEVGNLASVSPGATRRLILSLAYYFFQQGFKWLVMTATPQVQHSFEKLNLGLNLHPLASAEASALNQNNTDWGSYYEHQPQVFAGDIKSGIKVLQTSPLFKRMIKRIPKPVDDHNIRIIDGSLL